MRHNQPQNSKRPRTRSRRSNGHSPVNINRNTTFESNGPEGRLRGNAQQLFEKYTALAQDANAVGERISGEAFAQFADHYYRIYQTVIQVAEQQRSKIDDRNQPRKPEIKQPNNEGSSADQAHNHQANNHPAPNEGSKSNEAQIKSADEGLRESGETKEAAS